MPSFESGPMPTALKYKQEIIFCIGEVHLEGEDEEEEEDEKTRNKYDTYT